jgi:hypothetical protein
MDNYKEVQEVFFIIIQPHYHLKQFLNDHGAFQLVLPLIKEIFQLKIFIQHLFQIQQKKK